jgi:hypothetical protein
MYDLYQPLLNALRKQAMLPSLHVIWAWMQHLQFGIDLPSYIQVPASIRQALPGPEKGIYEWELALLARELLAVAPVNGGRTDLRLWQEFSTTLNELKNLDNAISGRYEKLFRERIFFEMARIAHQQFWWQRAMRVDAEVTRYLKIFGHPALGSILQGQVGLDARALYTVGLSAAGHFLENSELALPASFSLTGASGEQVAWFLRTYSLNLHDMQARCNSRPFDEDFVYALNPLVQFPLVAYSVGAQPRLMCPVPRYLIRRFTEGVYYDILNAPRFDSAFGTAYQAYVGEIIAAVNDRKSLTILPDAEYFVGKNRKQSVDWIASDSSGEMFVECKTKRLRYDAKIALADLSRLQQELAKLAEFAVQVYRTLADALEGNYPHWTPSERPIYPLVVTLEDWHVFGHALAAEVDSHLRSAFRVEGLNESMLQRFPLTTCSVGEFERLMALVAIKDVHSVMKEKVSSKRRLWMVHSALMDAFPEEYGKTRGNLFPEALESITGI